MNRRAVLRSLGAVPFLLALPAARAQPPLRTRRIGFLSLRAQPNEFDAAYREALHKLGYVEGRTLHIEYRWAAGSPQLAEALARELVDLNVEVIVAATTDAIRAAMRATRRIPIVMAASADPDIAGLVASIARPGGNVTGLSMISADTAVKRLQILHELVPAAKRFAVLLRGTASPGPEEQANARLVGQLQAAGRQIGVSIAVQGIGKESELEPAFARLERERAEALVVQASPLTIDHRERVASLAARHRIPAMYEVEGFVQAGGLAAYGPSLVEMYRRTALYTDKVLRGANPAELPVELPDRYELALNMAAARALGIVVPASLLVRVDRVVG